jgi:hypothetical protein
MKKIITLIIALSSTSIGFCQMGQIQNGGFENWTLNNIFDYPLNWGNSNEDEYRGVTTVLKSSDAQLGNYSVELIAAEIGANPDTVFGYVYQGSVGPSGPEFGIPYTAEFDEVRVQYESDLPVGDSLYMFMIRFNSSGIILEMIVEPIGYGTQSSWIQGSVSITNTAQAQLFIGFILGNPFNGDRPTPGAWARIDNVEIYNNGTATTNVPDPSFETWSTLQLDQANNWYTMDEWLISSDLSNVNKSIDSYTGLYAIELVTIQDPISADTISSFASLGPINFYGGPNPFMPAPYNANPTTFSGMYKYAPVNGDNGFIQMTFLQSGIPIGTHTESFSSNSDYIAFSSPLTIIGIPDSIVFLAFSGENPGSVLKLDDLAFSGGNVGLEEFSKFSQAVYPNPATDYVMIKAEGTYNYEIVNLSGTVVRSAKNVSGAKEINISDLNSGVYFVRINNLNSTEIHKLIIE